MCLLPRRARDAHRLHAEEGMRRALYLSRKMLKALAIVLAGAALGLTACEPMYVYRPAVSTTAATIAGLPASYYEVPPEAPRGHVRIATMGFAEIQPRGGGTDQGSLPALQ